MANMWWSKDGDGYITLNNHHIQTEEYIFPLTPLKLKDIQFSLGEYFGMGDWGMINTRKLTSRVVDEEVYSLQRTIMTRLLMDMLMDILIEYPFSHRRCYDADGNGYDADKIGDVKDIPGGGIVTVIIDIEDISSVRLTREYITKIIERCEEFDIRILSTPPPDSQDSIGAFFDLVGHLRPNLFRENVGDETKTRRFILVQRYCQGVR